MRTLAAYLAFTLVTIGTCTYLGQGVTAGLESVTSERNAQIQSLRR